MRAVFEFVLLFGSMASAFLCFGEGEDGYALASGVTAAWCLMAYGPRRAGGRRMGEREGLWDLWSPDFDTERHEVRGDSPQEVAEAWSEACDNEEGIVGSRKITVCVAPHGLGPENGVWFRVGGEMSVTYSADEHEPSAEDLKELG